VLVNRVPGVAIPSFILELRSLVGTRPPWLSAAIAVVVDGEGLVLLGRRADSGAWALPGGIIEPGEEPADAAARECFEETGVVVVPEVLSALTVSPEMTYANGDQSQCLEVTFRCRPVGGEACVNDDESLEVAWFPLSALPELRERTLSLIERATSGASGTGFAFSGPVPASEPEHLAARPPQAADEAEELADAQPDLDLGAIYGRVDQSALVAAVPLPDSVPQPGTWLDL
jgi:8-oxo-dGTP pyrophosphatase MutT (NUDIX family)